MLLTDIDGLAHPCNDPAGRILTRTADSATTTYTYDLAGNKLTVSAGGLMITAAYDRLNRVFSVDDEDADTTADTSYTYSLTSPTWSDPTGTYAATLDAFDRAVSLDDPAETGTSNFTWTYGTGGQVLAGTQGNGNTLDQHFDAAGHLLTKTTKTGGTIRADYAWTYNQAGMILSEASTITADPANGTVSYGYDPLGQLVGSTLAGTTTAYGWDTTTNRTSVQVGTGTAATTAYDAANRPTSGANPTVSYANDADGRLTARPNQTLAWDHLGRLTSVTTPSGTVAYTYDPLDRLRTVDYGGVGGGNRIRFRYVGMTTSAAQWLDDVAGTVTRSIGNGWLGERLMDWTGTSSNRRTYGENAHHDVTWLADSTGAVSQSLRYDPWGTPRSAVPQDYTPFRFQGSWYDQATDLSWVVTRWYAPSLGRFVSEDILLGEAREPDSRHLYAYAAGSPIGGWDPGGTCTQARPPAGDNPFYPEWQALCSKHDDGKDSDVITAAATIASVALSIACIMATSMTLTIPCGIGSTTITLGGAYVGQYVKAKGQLAWTTDWFYKSYPGSAVMRTKRYWRATEFSTAKCTWSDFCLKEGWYPSPLLTAERMIFHFPKQHPEYATRCWSDATMSTCWDYETSWKHYRWPNMGWTTSGPWVTTGDGWPDYSYRNNTN